MAAIREALIALTRTEIMLPNRNALDGDSSDYGSEPGTSGSS